jgi:hypothetical protein
VELVYFGSWMRVKQFPSQTGPPHDGLIRCLDLVCTLSVGGRETLAKRFLILVLVSQSSRMNEERKTFEDGDEDFRSVFMKDLYILRIRI